MKKALSTACTKFGMVVTLVTALIALSRETKRATPSRASAETLLAQEDLSIFSEHAPELLGEGYRSTVGTVRAVGTNLPQAMESWLSHNTVDNKTASKISSAILVESRRHRLDPVFLMAVIAKESRFVTTMVGGAGEIGLMQVRPSTAEWVAKKVGLRWEGENKLKDPAYNIRIGALYLSLLRKDFSARGSIYLNAYNMGPTRTRELLAQNIRTSRYANDVIRNYVRIHSDMQGRVLASLTPF